MIYSRMSGEGLILLAFFYLLLLALNKLPVLFLWGDRTHINGIFCPFCDRLDIIRFFGPLGIVAIKNTANLGSFERNIFRLF